MIQVKVATHQLISHLNKSKMNRIKKYKYNKKNL